MRRFSVAFSLLFLLAIGLNSSAGAYSLDLLLKEFFNVTKSILRGGDTLFDQLAQTQVVSVTHELYSKASDLKIAKRTLRKEILADALIYDKLYTRIGDLEAKVRGLSDTMTRFAQEIDRVSGLETGPLREKIHDLLSSKLDELQEVRSSWKPHDKVSSSAALDHLDKAIVDMEKLQKAAKCLSRTIESKRVACDPNKL